MDYARAVKNSLTLWVSDGPTLRLMGIQILVSFVFLFLLGGALWFFFAEMIPQVQDFFVASSASPEQSYAMIPRLVQSFLVKLIPFLLIVVPLVFLEMVALSYIQVSMKVRALNVLGFAAPELTAVKFVKYILLKFWASIMIFTSWYSRMFFFMFLGIIGTFLLAAIFAFIAPPIALVLAFIGGLAYFVYIFVIIYNVLRLLIAGAMYLCSDDGILSSVRRTWEFTQGKVVDIFLCVLILVIAIIAVSFALAIPDMVVRGVLGLLGVSFAAGFVFSVLYQLVISPIKAVMAAFMYPSVYYELTNPEQATVPVAPSAPAGPAAPEPAATSVEPTVARPKARARPEARKPIAKKGAPSRKK